MGLYEQLAEAYSQPSRGYRTLESGVGAIANLDKGFELARKRKLQGSTLEQILGGRLPEDLDGFQGLTMESLGEIAPGLSAIAKFRERPTKGARNQQANFLLNEKLMEYSPEEGYFPARIADGGGAPTPNGGKPLNITPRVAPTVPAEQTSKNADLDKLSGDIKIVRENYRPEFVGPVDNMMTGFRQMTGNGATPEAAIFKATAAGIRNKVLNLLSGAAISPDEAKRLLAQVPSESRSDVDFIAKVDNFERELNDIREKRHQAFSSSGYRTGPAAPRNGPPTFNSVEDAEASGVKGLVFINGRRAVID